MGRRAAKKLRAAEAVPAATPAAAEPEVWTVARLAAELRVPADHVERLQAATCIAGEDFIDAAGAAVFTPAGVEKIRVRVAEEAGDDQGAPDYAPDGFKCATFDPALQAAIPAAIRAKMDAARAEAEAAQAAPHREDLRLTRIFRWSRNVLAETPNGNEVVLTVRTIAHLEPGMVLRGCIRGTMGWTYEGRLPRAIGERQLYHPSANPTQTKGSS